MSNGLQVQINYPRSPYHGARGYVVGMTVPKPGMRSALVIHDTKHNLKHRVDAGYVTVIT